MTPRNISVETLARRIAFEAGRQGLSVNIRARISEDIPGISDSLWNAAYGQASLAIETAAEAAQLHGHQRLREALHGREPPSVNVGVMVAVYWNAYPDEKELSRTEFYVPTTWSATVDEIMQIADDQARKWNPAGGSQVVIGRIEIVSPVWWPGPFQG